MLDRILGAHLLAWAFSEQFEIGLLSEATIGQIQRYCCAYGFVDHVITPSMGMIWVVGGDVLDRYVVRRIEDHTKNPATRAIVRSALSPPLAFANVMALRYPWHRENRPGVHAYDGQLYQRQATRAETNPSELPTVPKFELIAVPSIIRYGSLACYGGSGVAGFRITDRWQWTGEAGGCTLGNDLPKGWSGDSLIFMAGPQWVLHTESRWSPHLDMRVGGQKVTEDYCLKYGTIGGGVTNSPPCVTDPTGWARHYETTGPALSFGTGVDLRLTRAFELRLADLDYMHSWVGRIQGKDFSQGVRLSFGVGLEIGTW